MAAETSPQVKVQLEGVEETLLIPLWGRAAESRRADGLFHDRRAVELVDAIDYDFDKFAWDWATQLSMAIRTEILDEATRAFIEKHPDALVINLAAGLDTRFYRLDNGRITWVDVDLPNSMALRRRFFNDTERHQYVTGSVLEDDWCGAIARAPGQPVLFIIEGLTMYFTREQTKGLLTRIATHFPGAEVLVEAVSPLTAEKSGWWFKLRGMNARFKGGIAHGKEIDGWDPRLRFIEEWYYLDRHPWRWGLFMIGRLIPPWREFFKIIHLKTNEAQA